MVRQTTSTPAMQAEKICLTVTFASFQQLFESGAAAEPFSHQKWQMTHSASIKY